MRDLYEMITDELFNNKSIAALLFLLQGGRELTFKYNNEELSITRDGEKYYLNSSKDCIQTYDSAWQLLEDGKLGENKFLHVWKEIELITLY